MIMIYAILVFAFLMGMLFGLTFTLALYAFERRFKPKVFTRMDEVVKRRSEAYVIGEEDEKKEKIKEMFEIQNNEEEAELE